MQPIDFGCYKIQKLIGKGSFGEVYLALDTCTADLVAIKIEELSSTSKHLCQEIKLYSLLNCCVNIPKIHWSGVEQNYRGMVTDLLGSSLDDLFLLCHGHFSLKTVLMCADQMLCAIEFVHNMNIIHRDIKPGNFLIGEDRPIIYLIDFGLSKNYCDNEGHIRYVQGKRLAGTPRYASVNAMLGYEQSRRDDLEALGYCFIYLLKGSLPWMGLQDDLREQHSSICTVKMSTTSEDLCQGFPEEFVRYFHAIHALRFNERPDYAGYRKMFRDLFVHLGYNYDYQYDWVNTSQHRYPLSRRRSNISVKVGCSDHSNEHHAPGISLLESTNMRLSGSLPLCRVKSQGPQQMASRNFGHPIPRPQKKPNR